MGLLPTLSKTRVPTPQTLSHGCNWNPVLDGTVGSSKCKRRGEPASVTRWPARPVACECLNRFFVKEIDDWNCYRLMEA